MIKRSALDHHRNRRRTRRAGECQRGHRRPEQTLLREGELGPTAAAGFTQASTSRARSGAQSTDDPERLLGQFVAPNRPDNAQRRSRPKQIAVSPASNPARRTGAAATQVVNFSVTRDVLQVGQEQAHVVVLGLPGRSPRLRALPPRRQEGRRLQVRYRVRTLRSFSKQRTGLPKVKRAKKGNYTVQFETARSTARTSPPAYRNDQGNQVIRRDG